MKVLDLVIHSIIEVIVKDFENIGETVVFGDFEHLIVIYFMRVYEPVNGAGDFRQMAVGSDRVKKHSDESEVGFIDSVDDRVFDHLQNREPVNELIVDFDSDLRNLFFI